MKKGMARLRRAVRSGAPKERDGKGGPRAEGRGFDVLIATLLGVAAVATAWAAYQAALADGRSSEQYNRSVALTDQASQSYNEGNQALVQDQAVFLEYVKAIQADDADLAAYVHDTLMSDDLVAAVDWWTKQPGDTYPTPFVEENPAYDIAAFADASRLDDQATTAFRKAKAENQKGDRYTLVTVILAAALFLLGVAGVTRVRVVELGFLALGAVFLLGSLVQLGRIRWG